MLTLEHITTTYSAKALRPPIVLDVERRWALARRPSWLPPDDDLEAEAYGEVIDDDAPLDCPRSTPRPQRPWRDLVHGEVECFEAHYNGQCDTYAGWAELWRMWWARIDVRKIYPQLVPPPPPQPFFRALSSGFARALEIGEPDEVAMWQRFGIAQFTPEDPRLVYLRDGDRVALARRILRVAAEQFPDGIVCLTSALMIHGLTDRCGAKIWMCGEELPLEARGIRLHSADPRIFSRGYAGHWLENGARMRVTTPARSIVDCFSWHRRVGLPVAKAALRTALDRKLVTPDD
jgi:hypothetical protein